MDPERYMLQNALRQHVHALAVEIGPRTPSRPDSLKRAADYIHSVLDRAGLVVNHQNYQYGDQQVTNLLATIPAPPGPLPIFWLVLITIPSRTLRGGRQCKRGCGDAGAGSPATAKRP